MYNKRNLIFKTYGESYKRKVLFKEIDFYANKVKSTSTINEIVAYSEGAKFDKFKKGTKATIDKVIKFIVGLYEKIKNFIVNIWKKIFGKDTRSDIVKIKDVLKQQLEFAEKLDSLVSPKKGKVDEFKRKVESKFVQLFTKKVPLGFFWNLEESSPFLKALDMLHPKNPDHNIFKQLEEFIEAQKNGDSDRYTDISSAIEERLENLKKIGENLIDNNDRDASFRTNVDREWIIACYKGVIKYLDRLDSTIYKVEKMIPRYISLFEKQKKENETILINIFKNFDENNTEQQDFLVSKSLEQGILAGLMNNLSLIPKTVKESLAAVANIATSSKSVILEVKKFTKEDGSEIDYYSMKMKPAKEKKVKNKENRKKNKGN